MELEKLLPTVHSPLVLCHNDLQYGNIMKQNGMHNGTQEVILIDFEYCSYNPRGYDIGNHFCEWAYDYHKAENAHLGDFSQYPTLQQQQMFCRAYLESSGSGKSDSDSGSKLELVPTEEEVEALRQEANVYSMASHLFWSLWGFIQASQSEIDFDFVAYAKCRYQAFQTKCTLQN